YRARLRSAQGSRGGASCYYRSDSEQQSCSHYHLGQPRAVTDDCNPKGICRRGQSYVLWTKLLGPISARRREGRNDKLPEFAADLVRRQVAVIVAPTTPSVLAAKAATKTIPIVFFTAGDPVDLGLVASLSRPDGNLTGATTLTLEVGPKWLQFLHEMVPHATSLALLINPTSPNLAEAQSSTLEAAARSRGLQLHVLKASTDKDFDIAFARVDQLGAS